MSEEAKAVQEVAKTSDTALKAARDFVGGFVKYFDEPASIVSGIVGDRLKVYRYELQLKLMDRINNAIARRGAKFKAGTIPLKIAVPLLDAGTMEDEDYLQEMWAQMFVNGADEGVGVELHRCYVDILERLTVVEAKILKKVYSVNTADYPLGAIASGGLPDDAPLWFALDRKNWVSSVPTPELELCLARLAQMGLLGLPKEVGDRESFFYVLPTVLGRAFLQACGEQHETD